MPFRYRGWYMTVEQWSLLSGHTVGDNRTGEMIFSSERKAVYRAANEAEGGSGCVWLFEAPDETVADERRNRFYEAMFLKHENILRITGAGTAQIEQQWFSFAVTEDLARPLSKEDSTVLAPVAAGIVAGLAELHSQGLVYCALSLQSVWQAEGVWKLADFSELRVEGTYDPQETKRLMTRSDLSVPPEAWDGVVSAKWDAWSLGTLVQRLGGTELTAELTEPDPAMRLSASKFRVPGPQAPAVSAVSEPQPILSKPAPELPAYVAPPSPPPSLSAHSERVHRNAYRLMRRPKRAILWSWVACGAALLLLVAMTMWGRHAAEPVHHEAARTRGSSDTPTAPVQAAPVQADDNSPESVIARWVEFDAHEEPG